MGTDRTMKRLFALVGVLLGIGALAVPPAHAGELVRVCVTVTPKSPGLYVNGTPLLPGTPGTPRICPVDV